MVRRRGATSAEPEITEAETETAAPAADGTPKSRGPRLGEVLLARELVTKAQLDAALQEHDRTGRRLGEVLVDSGALSERDLVHALSEQLQVPVIDFRRLNPQPEALGLIPEAIVRRLHALPIRVADNSLWVAVSGPGERGWLRELSDAAHMKVRIALATRSEIESSINRSYDTLADLDQFVGNFAAADITRIEAADHAAVDDEQAPVVQVVTRILAAAIRARASDIHIEPQDTKVRVRFRVDGALYDAAALPISIAQPLVSRIKIMSDMNIVERRRAQDGQFATEIDGRPLDVRVATASTIWGEKAVLRILDKSRSLMELNLLGMAADTRAEFSRLIRSPFGMVICAGPTGSGKTTTLYAGLNEINEAARNITTIEDPVEYIVPSINQIQINEQADITFSGGLRAILRQDPDVILVGEIRDVETARIAVQSALTGHLVLSSLHATDATAAVHRFLDMGIEEFLIASSVVGVVAQRLVRRICHICKEPYEPGSEEMLWYETWGGKPKDEFFHGAGCNHCANTGFLERVGVYELLKVTDEIKELIVRQAPVEEIRALALDQGMRTLRDEAVRLVADDITTINEVFRTIYVS